MANYANDRLKIKDTIDGMRKRKTIYQKDMLNDLTFKTNANDINKNTRMEFKLVISKHDSKQKL